MIIISKDRSKSYSKDPQAKKGGWNKPPTKRAKNSKIRQVPTRSTTLDYTDLVKHANGVTPVAFWLNAVCKLVLYNIQDAIYKISCMVDVI